MLELINNYKASKNHLESISKKHNQDSSLHLHQHKLRNEEWNKYTATNMRSKATLTKEQIIKIIWQLWFIIKALDRQKSLGTKHSIATKNHQSPMKRSRQYFNQLDSDAIDIRFNPLRIKHAINNTWLTTTKHYILLNRAIYYQIYRFKLKKQAKWSASYQIWWIKQQNKSN